MSELIKIPIDLLDNNKGQIAGVRANPRQIDKKDYQRLLSSLKESDITDIIPLKVYEQSGRYIVIGGNMRLRALRELKINEVSCLIIPKETPTEILNKAIILDNSTHGDWDWDMLANEWNDEQLKMWGVDCPVITDTEKLSGLDYKSMYYQPEEIPQLKLLDCYNFDLFEKKIQVIESAPLNDEQKKALKWLAYRFIKIDFESVANYYYFNASEDEKRVIERLRAVLIDNGGGRIYRR